MRSPQHSTPDDTTDLDTAIERLGTQRAASDALTSADVSTGADDGATSFGDAHAGDATGYGDSALAADLGVSVDAAGAEAMATYADGGYSDDGYSVGESNPDDGADVAEPAYSDAYPQDAGDWA